jgi:hypothetical protein
MVAICFAKYQLNGMSGGVVVEKMGVAMGFELEMTRTRPPQMAQMGEVDGDLTGPRIIRYIQTEVRKQQIVEADLANVIA